MPSLYKAHAAAVVTVRKTPNEEFLLLRRAEQKLKGVWLYVAGKVEEGETTVEAALRELKEEAGITPDAFYTADMSETYYDRKYDVMRMTPIFVAVVADDAKVTLDLEENDKHEWLSVDDACARLMPMQQKVLRHVHEYFIRNAPPEVLRLDKKNVEF